MNNPNDKLSALYNSYNTLIKPLIGEIEVRYECIPVQLLNEIRAFNDHIARYFNSSNDNNSEIQLTKANGHIERLILDCYKFLNVEFHKQLIKTFQKRTKNIDLTTISNGEFYIAYKKLIHQINKELKEAKLLETNENKVFSLNLYQNVYNSFIQLENLLNDNETHIIWSKAKFSINKLIKFLLWLAAAVASGFVSKYFF
ncbi:MAG: hypothetical protein LBO69_02180 [Ignavibacteria bacterium]|jgi:hypothetical protein|nr:hypothetical protein [Ignavibacteria bacterium]